MRYTVQPTKPPELTGADLRAFRMQMGWSATDLATALGTTYGAVWRWESGNRHVPGPVCAAVVLWSEMRRAMQFRLDQHEG